MATALDFSAPVAAPPGEIGDFSPPQAAPPDFSPPKPDSSDFSPPQAAPGTPAPLSDAEFQARMGRWGPILSGTSIGSGADFAQMAASGKFTPAQLQYAQTKSALRTQYIQEQAAKGLGIGDFFSGIGSGVGSLFTLPGRVAQDIGTASTLPAGEAAKRIASSLVEAGSQVGTGTLGLAKGLVTAPFTAAGRAWNINQPSPEQAYNTWELNYLATHAVPGFAPPSSTSRSQDVVEALTGRPAESVAAPLPAVTEAANLAMSLPIYGALGESVGAAAPFLKAAGAPNLARMITPASPIANAERLQASMKEALKAAPGAVPPVIGEAVPAVAGKTLAAGPVAASVEAVGKAAGAAGRMAQTVGGAPDKFLDWVGQKIEDFTGSEGLAKKVTGAKGWAEKVGVPLGVFHGNPLAIGMAAVIGLEKAGAVTEGISDFMQALAKASPDNPFGRFADIAGNPTSPPWMRKISAAPFTQLAVKYGSLAGQTMKGVGKGAAIGAGLSVLSGATPEEAGQNVATMGILGGIGGSMNARQSRIFDASMGSVVKYITNHLSNGGSADTLRLIPAGDILSAARVPLLAPDSQFRYATAADVGDSDLTNPFRKGGIAEGQGGWFDEANKTQWIDPTKRAPGQTLIHELTHVIQNSLIAQNPEIKNTLDSALTRDGVGSIDDYKTQYALRVKRGNYADAVKYMEDRSAKNPDWGYVEMMCDSVAHELEGKDLLSAMQGRNTQQTAMQIALNNMSGWLSDEGVRLRQNLNGTIFPDFKNVFENTNVRKLTYKLLSMQRESVLTGKAPKERPGVPLTEADMGGPKAPWYSVTDPKTGQPKEINPYGENVFNPKTGQKEFRKLPPSELRRRQRAEEAALDKYFPDKTLVTTMPAGLMDDPDITPWTKKAIKTSFDAIANNEKLSLWYHGIAGGKSATAKLSFAKRTSRDLGNVPVSFQSGESRGIEKTSVGNYINRWQSNEAENQLLASMAEKKGADSLDLWGGDQAKAKADIEIYKKNHAAGLPGESNGLGIEKRDVINKILKKTFRSLRLDRMEGFTTEPSTTPPANWDLIKRNFSPGLHAQDFSPSDDPRAVKNAAVRDKDTGKVYEGQYHAAASEKYLDEKYPGNETLKAWAVEHVIPKLEEGFTTNIPGEFLDRDQAFNRAVELGQYVPSAAQKAIGAQYLEAFDFNKQQQGKPAFSPSAEEKRDIELTGPDGKKYPAKYDGLQEVPGQAPWLQITPKVDLPGAPGQPNIIGKNSTTYAHSLAKAGYKVPDKLWDEVKKAAPAIQFSASDDPDAIKSAAIRDIETGKIYPGASHYLARLQAPGASDKYEDGYVTNSKKFLDRDTAIDRAIKLGQYKPNEEDYNVNKEIYGLTAERFNKQNPSAPAAGQYAKPIEGPKPKGKFSLAAEEKPEKKEKLNYLMEMAPGKASGQLPGLQAAPYGVKIAYQRDMTKALKPLFDEFKVKPGTTTKGTYKNSAGETEHNPVTNVELPAADAKLFGLLHGHFANQEAVAAGFKETSPGNFEPESPHSFYETGHEGTPFTDKIKALGPEAQAVLDKLQPEIGPAVEAVNAKWAKKLGGAFSPAAEEEKEPTTFYSQLGRVVDEKFTGSKLPRENMLRMLRNGLRDQSFTGEGLSNEQLLEKLQSPYLLGKNFTGATMPAAQLSAILRNPSNGIKADELKWSGLDDFLKGKQRVTKAEVQEYLKANDLTPIEKIMHAPSEMTEWSPNNEDNPTSWALHDSDTGNLVEPFIRIEKVTDKGEDTTNYELYVGYRAAPRDRFSTLEDAQVAGKEFFKSPEGETKYIRYSLEGPKTNYREILFKLPIQSGPHELVTAYTSQHWGKEEENVVAHARVDDRTDADGKPGLFAEEIQSDWHQEGRKHGYREGKSLHEQLADAQEAQRVPEAPFKSTWQETVFRRLVQIAAQENKDWIGWTTGKQQTERYSLEKHISALRWGKQNEELSIKRHGEQYFSSLGQNVSEKDLPNYIGKEVAQRLVDSEENELGFHVLTGLDLKIGGEGMSGFYDKILVDYANKFGKKFGSHVSTGTLPDFVKGEGDFHKLPITPEMKASVEKGVPLFSPLTIPDASPKAPDETPRVPWRPPRVAILPQQPAQQQQNNP